MQLKQIEYEIFLLHIYNKFPKHNYFTCDFGKNA